jgi:ATP-dependent helicase/nuclease subunit B
MDRSRRPSIYSIAPHKAFADALAAGMIDRFGKDKTGLARGLILLPNNRGVRTVTDAFVRRSEGGGLLLPRLVPIGDEELEIQAGGLLEPLDPEADPIPLAIAPVDRLMLLARLVQRHLPGEVDAAEALRLAEALAETLDQLQIEEVNPTRLRDFAADLPELSQHWHKSLERLELILGEWPRYLTASGRIDLADRRNRVLDAVARRWRRQPSEGFVVAAGINSTAPAIARLLRVIAFLPSGMVVLPALDKAMPEEEWLALGPHEPDPTTGFRARSVESHPQFHLKLLLERMGISRAEVQPWRRGGGRDAPPARSRAIAHAMAPAAFTAKWQQLKPTERRLGGVRGLELVDAAEEAQAIALAMREALESPEKTAALVTPDRGLARRVSAHLKRWGIEADDSAGRPLSRTAPGTLLLALVSAAVERFAPVPLLALLGHPLVLKGEARLDWLEGVRVLDLALRGPRPPAGLAAIAAYLAQSPKFGQAATWWPGADSKLAPLERAFEDRWPDLADLLATMRQTASQLTGDQVWAGPAGRAAAELFADLEAGADKGPDRFDAASLPAWLERMMARVAVRPPYGQHPRIFIWGLLEARLQHADLMVLGGLNEGSWPPLATPDPWLAPRIRHELGLPSLDRRIGLAAHDFATGLGAREVLITRSRRDARAPAIPSRFWLRLEAMTGGLTRSPRHKLWARAIDRPTAYRPADRPAPTPKRQLRPQAIWVTEVDRLKADPYAFYARKMLGLAALDPLDADPSPAWRGSAVHAVLEEWMKRDGCDPERLRERAQGLLDANSTHPLMRALWQPRLLEALEWIATQVAANRAEDRLPVAAEISGSCEIGGIKLGGKVDRIDRQADGSLAVVDYKTGRAPSGKAVREGFSMQLGLLGLIAEHGGFDGISGVPLAFEYWSLAKHQGRLGYVSTPVGGRQGVDPAEFTTMAARNFISAATRWLTGDAPFTAKLHPIYAPYGEYDQLMRLDEWYGREDREATEASP